ncbi:XRE family transcriptional regulator [Clostridiaceae bacterium]|nr:XRE family transcriptional regulator [Clostridiaceae bacterium]
MNKKYIVKLKIREAIEERGITQKKLAEMSGLRELTISDIVRGTRTVINFEHLSKIAEALEIDNITELIDFEHAHK